MCMYKVFQRTPKQTKTENRTLYKNNFPSSFICRRISLSLGKKQLYKYFDYLPLGGSTSLKNLA